MSTGEMCICLSTAVSCEWAWDDGQRTWRGVAWPSQQLVAAARDYEY